MNDDDRPFTIPSAAEYLDVSEKYIRDLCRSGRLGHFKLGKLIRISQANMREFMEQLQRESERKQKIVKRTNPADWRIPRPVE